MLPVATARAHLAEFRECRREMALARGNANYTRWRSNAHGYQWAVKQLRREWPRKRLPRRLEA